MAGDNAGWGEVNPQQFWIGGVVGTRSEPEGPDATTGFYRACASRFESCPICFRKEVRYGMACSQRFVMGVPFEKVSLDWAGGDNCPIYFIK
jgi:hypothetical protein